MLEILMRLSFLCGPFVLYEHFATTPVVVTPTMTIDTALAEWHQRMQWRRR